MTSALLQLQRCLILPLWAQVICWASANSCAYSCWFWILTFCLLHYLKLVVLIFSNLLEGFWLFCLLFFRNCLKFLLQFPDGLLSCGVLVQIRAWGILLLLSLISLFPHALYATFSVTTLTSFFLVHGISSRFGLFLFSVMLWDCFVCDLFCHGSCAIFSVLMPFSQSYFGFSPLFSLISEFKALRSTGSL